MPELPEVETIARGVDARVRGDRITGVWFGSHVEPFKTPPARQAEGLEGRILLGVERVGKHIVLNLSTNSIAPLVQVGRKSAARPSAPQPVVQSPDAQWIVHLGMTGRLLVITHSAPVAPHTHARLTLASGREIRFVDPRRFGRLDFLDLKSAAGFGAPGAEPLRIAAAPFAALFRGRRLAIKAALLNQTLLSGVGNIYADESLFRAGLRPRRSAGRLTRAELERLRNALRDVLRDAIRLGGSSVSDYVNAGGARGFFQLKHRVYQRTGEACFVCKTPIKRIVVAGRGTHYCPHCQL
jgi:formamidopyrimidine-DNA glycosylase